MVVETTGYEICPHRVLITGDRWLRSGSKYMTTRLLPAEFQKPPWATLFRLCNSNHTQNLTPARKAAQEAETGSYIGMSHDLRVMPRPSEACSILRRPGRSQAVP